MSEIIMMEEIKHFDAGRCWATIKTGYDGEHWRYAVSAHSPNGGWAYPYQSAKFANLFKSRDDAYDYAMDHLVNDMKSNGQWNKRNGQEFGWTDLIEVIEDSKCPQQIELGL